MLEPRPRRPWLQAGAYALLGSTALMLAAATPRPGDPGVVAAASALADQQQDPTVPPRLRDPRNSRRSSRGVSRRPAQRGIEGKTVVSIRVSAVGNVLDARIKNSSGEQAFDAAALRVARQTRFVPGRTRGRVATAWVDLPIVFSIPTSGLTPEQKAERAKAEVEGEVRRMRASNVRERTAVHEEPEPTPFTDPPILANREEVRGVTERFYPPLLKDAGIGGTALVRVLIDANGQVEKIQLVSASGHRALDEAAMKIAELMQFEPARNRDQRVNVWVTVPVTFTPPGDEAPNVAYNRIDDVAAAPTYTPFTVAPKLKNVEDVTKLLQAYYPPLLRKAGIGGSPRVWFFIETRPGRC